MKLTKKYTDFIQRKNAERALFWINLFLVPFLVIIIPDTLRFGLQDPLLYSYIFHHLPIYLLTYVFFLLIHFALTLLVKRIAVSQLILCALSCIAAFAHFNKVSYRSEPLFLSDIFQMFDALAAVDKGVTVTFSATLIFFVLLSILLFFAFLPVRFVLFERKKLILRLSLAACSLILLLGYTKTVLLNNALTEKFGSLVCVNITTAYEQNTFFLQFINTTQYIFHSVPEGYSKDTMEQILSDISKYDGEENEVRADIILVEVETWFRLDNYNVEFERDPFAPLNKLENVITGNVVTPKYGGGTSFVEYEALTGFSSSNNSGSGTSPFNLYLYDGFPGIVNYLNTLDYKTMSLHSYNNSMYNRKNAYPYLGFDESYFDDSFTSPEMLGEYISDDACFKKTIELYESNSSLGNVFIHVLTMQNHMPINANRFSDESEIIGTSGEGYSDSQLSYISHFATAMEKSNLAMADFIGYMEENADNPVIIIFFGDHQSPIVPQNETVEVLTATGFFESLNENEAYYATHITPYLIWSNIEADEQTVTFGNIPPNMLLTKTLCHFNSVRPAYFDYLLNSTSEFKGVSGGVYLNNDGDIIYELNESQLAEHSRRTLVEYDIIWGKKYLLNSLTNANAE